ncbi:hypothetical protein PAL_GLEAN10015452 [Pteropus alecto]|uniref:Uncharacterized protein n=1 Tax=Pteropus alecto TaxID=9402 RepID=L5KHR4_PTEAL|nr:hypothetical protein PAL_GLEAN10015452 [Pteropus alecto]
MPKFALEQSLRRSETVILKPGCTLAAARVPALLIPSGSKSMQGKTAIKEQYSSKGNSKQLQKMHTSLTDGGRL